MTEACHSPLLIRTGRRARAARRQTTTAGPNGLTDSSCTGTRNRTAHSQAGSGSTLTLLVRFPFGVDSSTSEFAVTLRPARDHRNRSSVPLRYRHKRWHPGAVPAPPDGEALAPRLVFAVHSSGLARGMGSSPRYSMYREARSKRLPESRAVRAPKPDLDDLSAPYRAAGSEGRDGGSHGRPGADDVDVDVVNQNIVADPRSSLRSRTRRQCELRRGSARPRGFHCVRESSGLESISSLRRKPWRPC